MSAAQVLQLARTMLLRKQHWTKEALYRDGRGQHCAPSQATCMCGLGAVIKASFDLTGDSLNDGGAAEILDDISREKGFTWFPEFNDAKSTTHDDVLNLFNTAIERAQA